MNIRSIFLIVSSAASVPVMGAEAWKNPLGGKEVRLVTEVSSSGKLQRLTVNGNPMAVLANSNISRENHGYGWMESAKTKWIADRFLIYMDESGLAIVDAETGNLLLNQVVTGYSESPHGQAWAAIRSRNIPRNQDALTGNEEDTLWFLDPKVLAENAGVADMAKPFAHVPSVQVGGIALAPPEWSEDGVFIILTLFSNGNILRDTYNAASHKRIGSAIVKDLGLSREQLLSLGFRAEVKDTIFQALAPGHSPGSDKGSRDQDALRPSRRGAVPEEENAGTFVERLFASGIVLWGTIAVVCIAAIAVLIKRSTKC